MRYGSACCTGRVREPGGYTGWVYRVGTRRGYTRVLPTDRARRSCTSEAGPVVPAGGGVGGYRAGCVSRRLGRLQDHPTGPVGLPGALPVLDPENAASWPIGRDLTSFPGKLVKTAECHPFSSKRPVIVPIYKTRSKSRLLKFPDFYIS